MTKQEKREWKAEKKLRKAVKKWAKVNPGTIEMKTHVMKNGYKYIISINRLG